ncbi:alpha-N-acetylglucosaminidase TIM-barrel domain-containing protein [Isoptericola sp. NPDC056573]|uniref:alpha-N-acetylglucosaminidase n=1 Tax=Isoptericola sp. NPDC056573 TaxID=3345868 RepID=UPI0036A67322
MTGDVTRGAAGVRRLVERATGRPARDVRLDVDPGLGEGMFRYSAAGGTLEVSAGDVATLGVGFARYLADVVGLQVTWDDPVAARERPDRWPDAAPTTCRTDAAVRYYLNVVTTGYSAPFWGWARWEREVDWMALHGVTAPLLTLGHEAVLHAAFVDAGATAEQSREWLGGAAYLPWTFMGSLSGFGGPLPPRWFERRAALARRVAARMRELGMRPVLPAFGGHVPDALAPAGARRTRWQGFTTALLEPGSAELGELAGSVRRHQQAIVGTDHLYSADPLIESEPPSADPDYLRELGRSLWEGIRGADPAATWVMQAWPFHYHRAFWTRERVDAFLEAVPGDRLLLLDLWAEHAPVWSDDREIARRPWVWCTVHNFGARFSLHGDLRGLLDGYGAAHRSAPATLRGVGLAPEAIEHNPAFYELATRLPWIEDLDGFDVDGWLAGFVGRRYRLAGHPRVRDAAQEAWRVLGRTVYRPGATRSAPSPVIARPVDLAPPFATQRRAGEVLDPDRPPSANVDVDADPHVLGDLPELARAAALLTTVVEELGPRGPWVEDLIDVTTHVAAQRLRAPVHRAAAAAAAGDAAAVRAEGETVLAALDDLAALAGTSGSRLAGRWVEDAARWGDDAGERAVLARDARRIVTVWGRDDSGLHDYSGRHWAGLVDGLYRPRWAAWFAALEAVAEGEDAGAAVARLRAAVADAEETWVDGDVPLPTAPGGDVVVAAGRLLAAQQGTHDRTGKEPAEQEEATR